MLSATIIKKMAKPNCLNLIEILSGSKHLLLLLCPAPWDVGKGFSRYLESMRELTVVNLSSLEAVAINALASQNLFHIKDRRAHCCMHR